MEEARKAAGCGAHLQGGPEFSRTDLGLSSFWASVGHCIINLDNRDDPHFAINFVPYTREFS